MLPRFHVFGTVTQPVLESTLLSFCCAEFRTGFYFVVFCRGTLWKECNTGLTRLYKIIYELLISEPHLSQIFYFSTLVKEAVIPKIQQVGALQTATSE